MIHLFGVPGIMFSGFLLVSYLTLPGTPFQVGLTLPPPPQATNTPALLDLPYIPLNLGGVGATVFCLFYILMEPVAGLAITPIIAVMMVYVNYLTNTYGSTANWWAFYVHAASWIVQFVGHWVFEKRTPAILVCLLSIFFSFPSRGIGRGS